jgi:hypothetical protein
MLYKRLFLTLEGAILNDLVAGRESGKSLPRPNAMSSSLAISEPVRRIASMQIDGQGKYYGSFERNKDPQGSHSGS